MPYESAEAWGKAMSRLFNPDPEDFGKATTPDDKEADARIRAVISALYIPDQAQIDIDGRITDYEGLVQSVYRVRATTLFTGALVVLDIVDYERDMSSDEASLKASCTWRITMHDHPAESGRPPAKQPLPPTVEVKVKVTLDKPGPEGRALTLEARSQSTKSEDSDSDD